MIYNAPARIITESRDVTSGIKRVALDPWDPAFDEALRLIPEDEDYPHALIRSLAEQRDGHRKQTWLLTQDGTPIAIAPLRKANAFTWQPVTQYILPGIVIPATGERLIPALAALGLTLRVALWRTDCALPSAQQLRDATTTVTHGIDCAADFEAYWKSTDIWRRLRSARNRWQRLTLKENAPGASEWIIANWAKRWGVAEDEALDRILAARFLEARGKHFSLTLFDGDRPLAGQTCVSHRGDMIGQCLYRENEDSQIGNRLLHLTFGWAQEKGFRAIDIGGGHDYKRKFAPAAGERHEFTIAPLWRYATEQTLRGVKGCLRGLIARPQGEPLSKSAKA